MGRKMVRVVGAVLLIYLGYTFIRDVGSWKNEEYDTAGKTEEVLIIKESLGLKEEKGEKRQKEKRAEVESIKQEINKYMSKIIPSERSIMIHLAELGYGAEEIVTALEEEGVDAQKQAEKKALYYIEEYNYSKKELDKQLENDYFRKKERIFVDENVAIKYKQQALKRAETIINRSNISEKALGTNLEKKGYTEEEVSYAIRNIDTDYNIKAIEKAKEHLNVIDYTDEELRAQLEYDGFTETEINYVFDAIK